LVMISPNSPDAMIKYSLECQELGVCYLFDPSQQIVRLDEDGLVKGVTGAHGLFVNEYEFELLQKHSKLDADTILGSVEFAVVTLGKNGSRVYEHGKIKGEVPVFPPTRITDPTGVGDAFRAGFLKGYLNHFDLILCAQMGALAATYCLEEMGPQSHRYVTKDFISRFRTLHDDQGVLDAI